MLVIKIQGKATDVWTELRFMVRQGDKVTLQDLINLRKVEKCVSL